MVLAIFSNSLIVKLLSLSANTGITLFMSSSGLVGVIERLMLQLFKIRLHPIYAFVHTLLQRDFIFPPETFSQLLAIKHVCSVLSQPFADNLNASIEIHF